MADIKTKQERSRNMAAIRSKNTAPELFLRKLLFGKGYRYRIHAVSKPGHPDIYLAKYNTAIFVNGCYWHRHQGCKYAYNPKSRIDFWSEKFENNRKRDNEIKEQLEQASVKCLVVWECTIRKVAKRKELEQVLLEDIERFFNSSELYLEL